MPAGTNARVLEHAMLSTPALKGVGSRALRHLIEQGSVRRVRKGAYLFFQDEPARDVFFLFDGRVELSSFSESGTRGLHTAIQPPQFFGELGVLAGGPNSTSAAALEDSDVWVLPARDFLSFLLDQPEVSLGFLRALARQLKAHESLVDDLLFLDLRGRVAKRLIGLVSPTFDALPEDGILLPSIVTHADLASLAGGSRENVTRILSDFQRRGIIARSGKRYVLEDVKALRRFARL